jgi:hypothetical protein
VNRLSEELRAMTGATMRSVGARVGYLPLVADGCALQARACRSHGARHNRRGERAEGRACYVLASQLRSAARGAWHLWGNGHSRSAEEIMWEAARARKVRARTEACRRDRQITRFLRGVSA